jgi:hypothetical protein
MAEYSRGKIYQLVEYSVEKCTSKSCEFKPLSWRGVLDTTLCDKVYQWLAAGQWFSPPIKLTAMI